MFLIVVCELDLEFHGFTCLSHFSLRFSDNIRKLNFYNTSFEKFSKLSVNGNVSSMEFHNIAIAPSVIIYFTHGNFNTLKFYNTTIKSYFAPQFYDTQISSKSILDIFGNISSLQYVDTIFKSHSSLNIYYRIPIKYVYNSQVQPNSLDLSNNGLILKFRRSIFEPNFSLNIHRNYKEIQFYNTKILSTLILNIFDNVDVIKFLNTTFEPNSLLTIYGINSKILFYEATSENSYKTIRKPKNVRIESYKPEKPKVEDYYM
ncbi:hypothetical protein GJ496_003879 [Pomphorhynchus laevis]|nr:hypothetical protein GJ496_003879 [Pomphorhynchus laevis]